MHLIKALIKKNVWLFCSGTILMVVSGVANIYILKSIGQNISSQGAQLLEAPHVFFGLVAIAFALPMLTQWMLEGISHNIVYQLRKQILHQLLQIEPEHMQRLGRSKIYNAFATDIPGVLQGVMTIPYSMFAGTLIIGGFAYLFLLSAKLAFMSIAIFGACTLISRKLINYSQQIFNRNRDIGNSLLTSYGNILDGHKELMLNESRGKGIVNNILTGDALESKEIMTNAGRAMAINNILIATIPLAIIGIVFWAIYQWQWASPETGVAFAVILMFLRQPISNFVNVIPTVLNTRVSLKHLKNLELPPLKEQELAQPICSEWNSLEVSNLKYRYQGNNDFELGPINLQIKQGELLFLVGSNGAGKSTLVKLLTGLNIPTEGSISLNNEVIDDSNRRQYRALFSAVLSDFFLFDQVLGFNEKDFQDTNANNLIKQLELQKVVTVDNGEFSTTKLSTGQRKRLAMIVACLEQRSIIVLDEWAADQDPIFRKRFYEQILPEIKARGITLVVVSHDDRYFHVADRIVSVESGKVYEPETEQTEDPVSA